MAQDQDDRRVSQGTQALWVSYSGTDPGLFVNDVVPYLQAVQYDGLGFLPDGDAGVATEQELVWIPAGTLFLEIWNTVALTSGTINIDLPAYGTEGAVNLVTAGALNAVGNILTAPVFSATTVTRKLSITVTTGTATEVVKLAARMQSSEYTWK